MKKLLATLLLAALALYCAGNLNYLGACSQAANSDGTDSDIAEIMISRGFPEHVVFQDATETEKFISLFKSYIKMNYRTMSQEEIQEVIENFSHSDWFSAHNTYCEYHDYVDDQLFEFDEDFFETYFGGRPMEAARATHFGEINWNDDYIRFNGYGNLESIRKYAIENKIDTEAITADILESPENYDYLFR